MSARTPVSPKVTASSSAGAVTVLMLYALGQAVPALGDLPDAVQAALLVVITGAVSGVAGWLRTDPWRLRHRPRSNSGMED